MTSTAYNLERPWERQPFDTERGWALFQEYLAQPNRPRTLRHLVRNGVTWSELEAMSWEDGWKARARLYDDSLDKLRQATIETEVQEDAKTTARRHIKAARKATGLAELELDRLLAAAKKSDAHGLITPRDLIRLLFLGVKLERMVQGEATSITETRVDMSNLSVEDLRDLRRLQQKTGTQD